METVILFIASLIASFAALAISYLVYKRDTPTLNTQINIIPDNGNDMVLALKKIQKITCQSTDGVFLYFQIANSNFRTITAMFIVDENNEKILPIIINKSEFGYTLTEGGTISHVSDVSKNGIELLRKAKKLYIKDTANRIHLVKEISGQQHLNT